MVLVTHLMFAKWRLISVDPHSGLCPYYWEPVVLCLSTVTHMVSEHKAPEKAISLSPSTEDGTPFEGLV